MHLIQFNFKKVFNPISDCTRGSDTTVGTEGNQKDVQRKNKIFDPTRNPCTRYKFGRKG